MWSTADGSADIMSVSITGLGAVTEESAAVEGGLLDILVFEAVTEGSRTVKDLVDVYWCLRQWRDRLLLSTRERNVMLPGIAVTIQVA